MFAVERLINIFAPHECLMCGDEGSILCAWCRPDIVSPVPERCYRCKQTSPDSQVCQKCRKSVKLRHAWVCSDYSPNVKKLIYRFKFGRAQAAADSIARLMIETLPWLPPKTLVIHIPTATSRRRQRGYDHSELLAKAIAGKLGLHHMNLLARLGQTRQVGAKRAKRLQQLQQAFRVRHGSLIKGSKILLVDDITTTGATLESAAWVLKRAGAKSIDALVFAQKQ